MSAIAPSQLRLFSDDQPIDAAADALATRLATARGLVRSGASRWDGGRTPVHPLAMESAYADPEIVTRIRKHHHAGLIVASPSAERVRELLDNYTQRFYADFHASAPPPASAIE